MLNLDLSNPDLKGRVFEIKDGEINNLFKEASKLIDSLTKLKIKATPNEVSCRVCDVAKICPKNYYKNAKNKQR